MGRDGAEGSYGGAGAGGGWDGGGATPSLLCSPPPPHGHSHTLGPTGYGAAHKPPTVALVGWGRPQSHHCGVGDWGGGSPSPHLPPVPHCPQGHTFPSFPYSPIPPPLCPWLRGHNPGGVTLWGCQWGRDAGTAPPPSSPINNPGCDPKGRGWGKPQCSFCSHCCFLEGPTSPHPHISVSPYLHVPTSPYPHISVSPQPHIPSCPDFPPPQCAPYHPSLGPLCPHIPCAPPYPHISHSVSPHSRLPSVSPHWMSPSPSLPPLQPPSVNSGLWGAGGRAGSSKPWGGGWV